MILSPRRFWCGLCICVALATSMLIEPVQRMAKQSAIKIAFSDNLSASNFQFHRNQQLLEVNSLRASQCSDESVVSLTADRALVGLDMPKLLDKRFVSSKMKLQGVRIELTALTVSKPTIAPASPWQDSLNAALAALEWENLRQDCEALIKAESILNELDKRMRGWLLRSQQILLHGEQLSKTIQSHSNPLRHQSEIRKQLALLDQLRVEQVNLEKQFSGVNAILTGHIREIQKAAEQDIATIRVKCNGKSSTLRNLIAEQMVTEWSQHLVTRQLILSRSIATLLPSDGRNSPYDVDFRSVNEKLPLLSLSGIEAEGFLDDSLTPIPFAAKGEYSLVQQAGYQLGRKTAWSIRYDSDRVATTMQLRSVDTNSSWSLTSDSSESKAGESLPVNGKMVSMRELAAKSGETLHKLEASIDGRRLIGKMHLNLSKYDLFAKLPCAGNADLSEAGLSSSQTVPELNEKWIELELSGLVNDPHVKFEGELPSQFIDAITGSIQKRLENQIQESESMHKLAITAKIDELSKRVEMVAEDGRKVVANQCEAFAAMHRELQKDLDSHEGLEYARLPTNPKTER